MDNTYEQKYKEALARAREIHCNEGEKRRDMEFIFPELKESEDEKVREALIELVKMVDKAPIGQIFGYEGIKYSDMIVWLEKQGEQKSTDKVESKFKKGDVIRLKHGDGLEWIVEDLHKDGYYTIVNSDKDDFIKLDDNWEIVNKCEEDEDMCYKATAVMNRLCAEGKEYVWSINTLKKLLDWLKSFRPQNKNTWKPSDEQMKALNLIIIAGNISSVKQVQELTNLYKDLKKLREE